MMCCSGKQAGYLVQLIGKRYTRVVRVSKFCCGITYRDDEVYCAKCGRVLENVTDSAFMPEEDVSGSPTVVIDVMDVNRAAGGQKDFAAERAEYEAAVNNINYMDDSAFDHDITAQTNVQGASPQIYAQGVQPGMNAQRPQQTGVQRVQSGMNTQRQQQSSMQGTQPGMNAQRQQQTGVQGVQPGMNMQRPQSGVQGVQPGMNTQRPQQTGMQGAQPRTGTQAGRDSRRPAVNQHADNRQLAYGRSANIEDAVLSQDSPEKEKDRHIELVITSILVLTIAVLGLISMVFLTYSYTVKNDGNKYKGAADNGFTDELAEPAVNTPVDIGGDD